MKKFLPVILVFLGLVAVGIFCFSQDWWNLAQNKLPVALEGNELKQKIWDTFDSGSDSKTVGTFATPEALNGDLGRFLLAGYQKGIFSKVGSFEKERIYSYFTVTFLELVNENEKITIAVARDSDDQQDILFFAAKTPIDTKIENIGNTHYQYKILLKITPEIEENINKEWLYLSDINTKENDFFMETSKKDLEFNAKTTENGPPDLIVRGHRGDPFMDYTFYNQSNENIFEVRDLNKETFDVGVDYIASDSLSYKSKKIVLDINFKYGQGEYIFDLTTGKVTKVE